MKSLLSRRLAATATAVVLACLGPLHANAADLISVTLLGTGSPRPTPERNGPSTLVEVGGERLLFDMGRNNTVGLFRAKVPLGSITAHFLTHLHSDHVNGLPDLYLTGWIGTPYANRQKPFLIYGPSGTQDMMRHLYEAFSWDRNVRHADEGEALEAAQVEAHDVEPGVVYQHAGIKVSAFRVNHGELIEPSFGYKIEYKGHKVVLSGDTKPSSAVEREGTGADLLIHEVASLGPDATTTVADSPIYRAILDHHTTPEQAGALFSRARPKLAVYSHIVLPSAGIANAADLLISQTRKTYGGPLVVGEDGMRFSIGEEGIAISRM